MEKEEIKMHWDASPRIFEYAKQLRHNMTEAEKILWKALKKKQLSGFKFRRQHPIGSYIVDFYCHQKKLAIEVDGKYHDNEIKKLHDQFRTEDLNRAEVLIIRFTNEDVFNDLDYVLEEILFRLNE